MSNVIELNAADETLVELAENLLNHVKKGTIASIAGAIITADGELINFSSVENKSSTLMLGGLYLLIDAYKDEHLTEYEFDD